MTALFEHSPWVEARADARPSSGDRHADLMAVLSDAAPEEQLALIRAHPDLGERVAPLTNHSRREQVGAGLDRLSQAEYERFMATNAAYREKFGIPFVVCVREHTKESILENAQARLENTPEQETATALGEIAKIARLRLEEAL